MSAQNTPGPWSWSEDSSFIRDANGVGIAKVYAWSGVTGDGKLPHKANAALIARAPDLAAENEQLKAKLEIANEALYRTATRIRDLRDDLPLKDDKRSHELLVSIGIEIRENLKALTTHPARGEDGAR